jgi:hypothetical protein
MRDETFAELIESARQALAYENGGRANYRVTRVEIPASTKTISAGKAIPQRKHPERLSKAEKCIRQKVIWFSGNLALLLKG